VIAVDRLERHFFPPSLLWLMVGERKPEDFTRSLDLSLGFQYYAEAMHN